MPTVGQEIVDAPRLRLLSRRIKLVLTNSGNRLIFAVKNVRNSAEDRAPRRLADTLFAQDRVEEAEVHLKAARLGFEELLGKYPLAFADHAAEFYAGSGNDYRRALDLALMNAANRPNSRAITLALEIATKCGRSQ